MHPMRKIMNRLTESVDLDNDPDPINPENLDFDTVYKNGEYFITDKATKWVIATAGSGGQALSLLDRWNSSEGKIRAAKIFHNRLVSDTDYERYK